MGQPSEVLALSDELRTLAARAWQQLQDDVDHILDTWPQASRDARRERLQDLQATVGRLMGQVDEVALALATGGMQAAYQMGASVIGGQFTAVDIDALGVLANDLYSDVLSATKGVSNSSKLLIRTLAREHVSDRLLGGQTAADSARALRKDLEGHGLSAITYKDGSRRGLADYTDMLARTKTAEAYSTGTILAAKREGVGFMEIFDGFGCGFIGHDDTDKANGTIRSVDECSKALLSHPRCQRAFGPRIDVESARDAKEAVSTQTAAQAEDQRQVAIARQARVEARARRLAARNRKLAERANA